MSELRSLHASAHHHAARTLGALACIYHRAQARAYRFRISTGSGEAQEEGGGMMLPRFAHKAYAKAMGYFWLPCPVCGRMFGGHEARSSEGSMLRMVCSDPFCVYTARTKPPICGPK